MTVVTAPTASASDRRGGEFSRRNPAPHGSTGHQTDGGGCDEKSHNRPGESDDRRVGRGQADHLPTRGAPQPEQCLLTAVGLGEGGTGGETECTGREHPGNPQQQEQDLRVGGVGLGSHQRLGGVVGNQDRARRPALQQRSKLPRPCRCATRVRRICGVVHGDVGFQAHRRQIGGTGIEHRGDTTVGGPLLQHGQDVARKVLKSMTIERGTATTSPCTSP